MKSIYLWAIAIWFLFAVLATINGAIRNATYQRYIKELYSHQISTMIFIAITITIMFLFFNKTGLAYTNADLWLIGSSWLIATIIFEFVFGHFIFGNSWTKLFADYNILKGRIWSLILLMTLIGPWLVGKK